MMQKTRKSDLESKQTLLLQIFFLLISVTLQVGCTKGGKSSNKAESDTFVYNLGSEPETLNPIKSSDGYGSRLLSYVCGTLMDQDPETFEVVPHIAEKAEVAKDKMSFTYTLRADAKFSDGKPITAEDVKFSFDAIFDDNYAAAHLRPYFEGIGKVEILAPNKIKFSAKKKLFANFDYLNGLRIVPKHIYGDSSVGKDINKEVTCSGPYKLESYNKGQSITIRRDPDWFGFKLDFYKNKYLFERIRFRFISSQTVALEMLKAGEIDYITRDQFGPDMYVKLADGPEWGKSVLKIKAENKEPKSYGYLGWNLKRPMFQDKKVRRALAHLFHREEMNEKFRFGMSLLASGPTFRQSDYADPTVEPIEFNPQKAKALLAEAGWADTNKDGLLDKVIAGKKTNFEFTVVNASKDAEKYLVMYQEDLKKSGIKLNIQLLDWTTLMKKTDERDFDSIAMAWGGGAIDWDPKQVWHSSSNSKGGSNYIGYANTEVDRLIDQAREEFDKAKRIKLLHKVFRIIADEAPYAFFFNNKYWFYGVSARVHRPQDIQKFDMGVATWSFKPAQQ